MIKKNYKSNNNPKETKKKLIKISLKGRMLAVA